MIYILGINHKYQNNPLETEEFKNGLTKIVKNYNITFIGEEYAEYETNLPKSSVKELAEELGIGHKYCDLDESERKTLGIPSREEIGKKLGIKGIVLSGSREDQQITAEQKRYHHILEKAWYQRLKNHIKNHKFLLFICGEDHRKSFGRLLEKEDVRVDYTALTGRFRT